MSCRLPTLSSVMKRGILGVPVNHSEELCQFETWEVGFSAQEDIYTIHSGNVYIQYPGFSIQAES